MQITTKTISSAANADIKRLISYRDKARARKKDGLFLIEGIRLFMDTPDGWIKEVFISSGFVQNRLDRKTGELQSGQDAAEKLQKLAGSGIPVTEVSDPCFKQFSDTVTSQGILCTVKMPVWTVQDIITVRNGSTAPLVIVLDSLQDPGNLGTIFRSALAAGSSGILMNRETADIFNPKAVRSTMSAVFKIPFVYSDDLPGDLESLKDAGLSVMAADMDGADIYTEAMLSKPCAIVIGNEGNGISPQVMALADQKIYIPMDREIESLNAAVAAGVLLFEAARQRRRQ